MSFIKQNKFLVFTIVISLSLFVWAEASGFKLFKSEYGTKYAPNTTHGSVQHK